MKNLFILVLSLFLVSACASVAEPTSTPEPTSTKLPTQTSQPTIAPSATTAPVLSSGDGLFVDGLFSFELPESFQYSMGNPGVFVANQGGEINYALRLNGGDLPQYSAEEFIADLMESFDIVMPSDTEEIEVDGELGLTTAVSLQAQGLEMVGEFVVINTSLGEFFMIGFAREDLWVSQGQPAMEFMLETMNFGGDESLSSECTVSTDPSYGVSIENPVKVGGQSLEELSFDGPDRERAYLAGLLAPNGDSIEYMRTGSLEGVNTILDAYEITSTGFSGTKTIYIDMYNYETLFAPQGFICSGLFLISEP